MALKHHTLIFVPHARARLRKWRVSNLQLALLASSLLFVTAAALYVSWSFLTSNLDREEIVQLRQRNENLREAADALEGSVAELRTQLADYEERTRKLAILAGIETLETGSQAGIGGVTTELPNFNPADELRLLGNRLEGLDGTLDEVEAKLEEQARWVSALPSIAPVKGVFSSGYGYRKDPLHGDRAFHQGIDISAAPGAPVHASADGIVTLARRHGGFGKAVSVSHGYGLNTLYGHMSRIAVKEGVKVRRGDVIGYVGNTGRSTGYHLHYEVRVDGKPTNPMGYILEQLAGR